MVMVAGIWPEIVIVAGLAVARAKSEEFDEEGIWRRFADTGEALVSSVDKIIFVGSSGVGRMIMRKAADTLIPVTLELDGKDPFIVCEDVDVPHVAQVAVRAALQSSGQNCAGAERFYVHKDIYPAFVAAVVKCMYVFVFVVDIWMAGCLFLIFIDDGHPKENSFIYIPSRRQTDKVQCYEPATMKYLGYFPALKPHEVKERVAQVRRSQTVWAKSSFKQRRQFLRVLLKYIIEHQDLICEVSSRDTGKTMVDASMGEIMTTCEKITWLLSEGEKWLKPEYISCGRSMLHKSAKVEFHPLGVVGAIVSWNYPFHNLFNPVLAAVFSGNGIVVKVSEHASWSECFYVRILQTALAAVGAPENLAGFAETGEALVSSVDKIIFVGSPGVGRMVLATKDVLLFDHFDLARFLTETVPHVDEKATYALSLSTVQAWNHSDFLCRNYVLNGMVDALYNVYCKAKTAKEWESLDRKYKTEDAGMSLSETFQVACIIEKLPPSWVDFKNYLKHKRKEMTIEDLVVRLRIEEDNKIVLKRIDGPGTTKANVVEHGQSSKGKNDGKKNHGKGFNLGLKGGVGKKKKFQGTCYNYGKQGHRANECKLPKKENARQVNMIMRKAADTLIPVTLELGGKDPFIVCEDVDVPNAIKLANDSKYGLGCAVFSGSQRRARFIASQLHYGVAAINDFASNYMCQSLPFGGVKDSGFGRFAGVEGLHACCLVKSVVEDRWWPLIKTKIPKPIQYPVAENGFEFQQSLVEALYGLNVWDRLRALVNVIKMLTDQNTASSSSSSYSVYPTNSNAMVGSEEGKM
ncbi:aldehyde dehydrogenase 22A1-like [Bidens hawaiensis]|uniref:aldehyde dehydrogenase 22A1-like n=1 Tax=Bidens hawaiensis TaxID=980011 RepID=UPI00404A5201